MDKKWVYLFSDGNADMRNLLGGKGANLAEMTRIGLPVPQGFTVSTEACIEYLKENKLTYEMIGQINSHMSVLEDITKKNSAIKTILCWYPYAPARESQCLV